MGSTMLPEALQLSVRRGTATNKIIEVLLWGPWKKLARLFLMTLIEKPHGISRDMPEISLCRTQAYVYLEMRGHLNLLALG